MIKLDININPDGILPDKTKYDQEVDESLQEIAAQVPNHKEGDFENRLWGYFKQELWKQQGYKCAFCEKSIVLGDSHVEHFRAKSEVRNKDNSIITRKAYWWLAYEHKNYMVSCSTCNNQKGNRFPIKDEDTRVLATDMNSITALTDKGVLGDEIPYIINPRYQNTESYLAYNYRPDTQMVFIVPKDDDGIGKKTIDILDLNRERKNEKMPKDYLPHKRGCTLFDFKKEIENFNLLKLQLNSNRCTLASLPGNANLQKLVDDNESVVKKKRDNIKERFLSNTAEFSGMCLFWLKNDTGLEDDFKD